MDQPTQLHSRVIGTKPLKWKEFQFIQNETFKDLSPHASDKLKKSILENQFSQPFYVWLDPKTGVAYCLDGKHRIDHLKQIEADGIQVPELLPATLMDCKNKQEAAKLVLVYSSMYAKVTESGLFEFLKEYEMNWDAMRDTIDLPNFDSIEFEGLRNFDPERKTDAVVAQSLAERFIIPPFSIFDSRQGYWQDRKKKWHSLFDSQASREDIELIAESGQSTAVYELRNKMRQKLGRDPEWSEIIEYAKAKGMHIYEGASIFDPVLAEILYTWFCPKGAVILDPFAGGSVRGIVAAILGFSYYGIDLREDQVQANKKQAYELMPFEQDPIWVCGDSNEHLDKIAHPVDFIFSCPPYHDLEQYSDDPADLSNMTYEQFCDVYWSIIYKSLTKLKPNRFACFVVGDIRDKEGFYRDFVSETISAFTTQALPDQQEVHLYNEIILVNVAGSLPIRIGRQFGAFRKVGKTHQNVLVFYKGDPKKIKQEFPEIKVEELVAEGLIDKNYQPNIALSVID